MAPGSAPSGASLRLELPLAAGVDAGALRKQENEGDHDRRDDPGGGKAAEVEAAKAVRFVEQVAERRPERPRQDERRPEQERPRNRRVKIESRQNREAAGE